MLDVYTYSAQVESLVMNLNTHTHIERRRDRKPGHESKYTHTQREGKRESMVIKKHSHTHQEK